jgi:hypothetical protein
MCSIYPCVMAKTFVPPDMGRPLLNYGLLGGLLPRLQLSLMYIMSFDHIADFAEQVQDHAEYGNTPLGAHLYLCVEVRRSRCATSRRSICAAVRRSSCEAVCRSSCAGQCGRARRHLAAWSSGMILASGARNPVFNSRSILINSGIICKRKAKFGGSLWLAARDFTNGNKLLHKCNAGLAFRRHPWSCGHYLSLAA